MFSKIVVVALGSAVAASALVPRAVCNADNCLRALRASSPKTRLAEAEADCSAWLAVTSTPVETATVYTTIATVTDTVVEGITTSETIHDTFTSTVLETPTETVYTSTTTVTVNPAQVFTKRAEPSAIPTYAAACSGTVRYSSACSCIGVSNAPTTITAPTRTTTVTIPTTALETAQVTSAVATSLTTVYDATVTVTVTQPATTVSNVATATATAVPESPPRNLKFYVEHPALPRGYLSLVNSGIYSFAIYTANAASAVTLTLKADGTLWYGNKVAKGWPYATQGAFYFVDPAAAVPTLPYTCTYSTDSVLTCMVGSSGNDKLAVYPDNITKYIYALPNPNPGTRATLRGIEN